MEPMAAMASPASALPFGEEDQDFSFEDQLAEEDSFEEKYGVPRIEEI